MSLLEEWRDKAYNAQSDQKAYAAFWNAYFVKEQGFYEKILSTDRVFEGTVVSLAEEFGVEQDTMVGILDGINDSLVKPNPIEKMTLKTKLSLDYDKEKLYKNMVIAKADWLYNLPMWDSLLDADKRDALYKEAKLANTVIKQKKIGRNDPCPCGSGKKYKFCCGR